MTKLEHFKKSVDMLWTKFYRMLISAYNLRAKIIFLILFTLICKVYYLIGTIQFHELVYYLGNLLYSRTEKVLSFLSQMYENTISGFSSNSIQIEIDEAVLSEKVGTFPYDSHIFSCMNEISSKLDAMERTLQTIRNHPSVVSFEVTPEKESLFSTNEWGILTITSVCISLMLLTYITYKYVTANYENSLDKDISLKMTSLIEAQSNMSKFGIEKSIQGIELTNTILMDFIRESYEHEVINQKNIQDILVQIMQNLCQLESMTSDLKNHLQEHGYLLESVTLIEEDSLQILYFIKSIMKVMELDPSFYLPQSVS